MSDPFAIKLGIALILWAIVCAFYAESNYSDGAGCMAWVCGILGTIMLVGA